MGGGIDGGLGGVRGSDGGAGDSGSVGGVVTVKVVGCGDGDYRMVLWRWI